ncbi:hypothetical protein DMC30DRAFT_165005 [Rhodotorula diobovata]|uniref:Uncharacterized protein n=1 Tax=Rhodotorula diobovata TaxID=5288 RepID=A0A5C5G5H3_9BASI|nr:hypothetical protein DMC30DRAFT_165005 [Rhodotorula diobovata]
MDDELDPAFLDLDLPAPHASTSSLGPGFGSTLDSDNDNDDDPASLPSHGDAHALDLDLELELGSDYALGAGGALDELDTLRDRVVHDPPATPARRRGGSTLAAGEGMGGLSLADELASAARPQRQRDLMRELGLGSDEEDGAGVGQPSGDDYSDQDELEMRREDGEALGAGLGRLAAPSGDEDDPFGSSPRRSASSLGRTPRTRPSTASLTSYTPGRSTPDDLDAEAEEAAQQEEVDAALQDAATSLEDSMHTLSVFLGHLRQHVTAEVDVHSANPAPAAAPDVPSSAPNGAAAPVDNIDYIDRQPIIESHASTLVRRLYDLAKQREAQLRELGEMERVLGRTEPGWRAVLAELEPLELSEDEEDGGGDGLDEPNGVEEHGLADELRAASPLGATVDATAPRAPHPRARSSTAAPSTTLAHAQDDLAALRALTASLLSALSTISDLAQVQSALASDFGRKLRALKTQAGAVRDELGAVDRSEAFVKAYEGQSERARTTGEGRAAESVRREVEAVRDRLEEGWTKAQSMLAVRA